MGGFFSLYQLQKTAIAGGDGCVFENQVEREKKDGFRSF